MKELIMGNHAVALGALKAGMTFFAGYPITPASEIMHFLANKGIEFVHTEDEIAAANMIVGSSLSGRKSMTSTSGPGMSLMQEAIGLGHMMEVPMVIVNVQRVGPSTGMPTLPAQGDILQAKHGSHGDYTQIVFYPNSVEECYRYAIEAFNASEESRSPVIFLMDGFVGHLMETVNLDAIHCHIVPRTIPPLGGGNRHFTGLLSKNGIPCTMNSDYYREWFQKMKSKAVSVSDKYNFFEYIRGDGNTLIIAYGIVSRVVLPLIGKYSLFRPIRMFPVLEKELKEIASGFERIIVVEMNDGQYKGEIERVLKRDVGGISLIGGDLDPTDVSEKLEELSNGKLEIPHSEVR